MGSAIPLELEKVPVSRTEFSPRVHGFHFANAFRFSFEFNLPFFGRVDLGSMVYGLCGGMCFAALDYLLAGRPMPTSTSVPPRRSGLYAYLWQRQLDSFSGPVLPLKVIEWMLRTNEDVERLTAGKEFPRLRTTINQGTPAVLCLIRARGLVDPTQNHQVLATGYRLDTATGQVTIHVYDPSHPGQEPTLSMSLGDPDAGIDLAQSTRERLRGFFVVKYRAHRGSLPEEE